MITNIKKIEMVSVPSQVLLDLIANCELTMMGESKCEEVIGELCRELQRYLGGDSIDEGISFDEFDNVEFVNFKTHD